MEKGSIILLTCGHFEEEMTSVILRDVRQQFLQPVMLKEFEKDLSIYYNPLRRQYDANALLKMIGEIAPADRFKVMGLFRVDLYIPILTYIFGQAPLKGDTGIVSKFRLRNELYGLPPDYSLLTERFSKVIMHELGHSFGLIHCHHPVCLMRSSTYVEDLDQKEAQFCIECREYLQDQT